MVTDPGESPAARRMERVRQVHEHLNGPQTGADLAGLVAAGGRTRLPPARTTLGTRLTDALWQRRSAYRYGTEPLDLEDLSTLLRLAAGPQRPVPLPDGGEHRSGMAPSAGGLSSLDTYAVVRAVRGLPPGVHRHDRDTHDLVTVRAGNPTTALRSVLVQTEFADRAPVVLAVAARLDTTLVRYPERHYRTLHVDAGVLTQNLYLVATALDLACCAVAGFHDRALAELLGLGDGAVGVLLLPLGRPHDGWRPAGSAT